MEDISEGPLGCVGGDRLHNGRSLGKGWPGNVLSAVVMEIATRRVCLAGYVPNPDELWMMQVARNLTDAEDGFLKGKRYVLMDRDGKFCPAFRAILKTAGVEALRLPPRSPNLNAHLERFHRSLREECIDRMIFFGEASLRKTVLEFLAHCHAERNYQGLENRLIEPGSEVGRCHWRSPLPGATWRSFAILLPRRGMSE
jgi:transposase InsO family protein